MVTRFREGSERPRVRVRVGARMGYVSAGFSATYHRKHCFIILMVAQPSAGVGAGKPATRCPRISVNEGHENATGIPSTRCPAPKQPNNDPVLYIPFRNLRSKIHPRSPFVLIAQQRVSESK